MQRNADTVARGPRPLSVARRLWAAARAEAGTTLGASRLEAGRSAVRRHELDFQLGLAGVLIRSDAMLKAVAMIERADRLLFGSRSWRL